MKTQRHSKIIELISDFKIETQEELADRLRESGYDVTQATVSRDIRQLMLTKNIDADGTQRYAVSSPTDRHVNDRYVRVFRDGVIGMDYAQNILVIKTLQGTAMAVAAAFDSMNNPESLGCIAGDDIIMCVLKTEEKAIALMNKLKGFVSDDVKEMLE